ncbi:MULTISPECIES: WXG100 family type VII secretion target [unclassified Actinotalea]|uniref:WXG100 family type VII secretion target n=1 Tax=unclassified Actinotalea TaxID=2638618 RepID=UPI0015F42F6C|nr:MULTISPECIES: hypothetical protein [unclassified Actinotalea]
MAQYDGGGQAWAASAGLALVPPVATDPMPDLGEAILGWQNYVSASYCINEIIEMVCGFDPFTWLSSHFTGSWEEFSEAGAALANLSNFVTTTRGQLSTAVAPLNFAWTGNAATAALAYFESLEQGLTTLADAIDGLAEDFQTTAFGVWSAGQAAVTALAELCDWLILLALELAAAASSSWTIVGGLIAGSAAAATALKAGGVWREVVKWHGRAVGGAEGFAGLAAANLSLVHGLEGVSMPGSTLDIPGTGKGK